MVQMQGAQLWALFFILVKIVCMKALVLEELGKPMAYREFEDPERNSDLEVVHLKSAALNHRDLYIQQGKYPKIALPMILGSDGSGVCEGKNVIINPGLYWGSSESVQSSSFQVLGMPTNGTFAELVAVPASNIYGMPAHLNWHEAAALPLAGITAYRALFTKGNAKKGDRVLISGAGGGVAQMAMQFAVALGCEVYVTSGSDHKIERAVQMGALGGVNYQNDHWQEKLTEKAGKFDVIIDSAGGEGFRHFIPLAAPAGRIVFYGATRGKIKEINPYIMFWRQVEIKGTTMGSPLEFQKMLDFVTAYEIRPQVDEIVPLEDGNLAFERMAKGKQYGKIVLEVSS